MNHFKVGQIYNTLSGHAVRIVEEKRLLGYEVVRGSDGLWRYGGRVTGSSFSDPDPRHLVVPPPAKEVAPVDFNLLIDELINSWGARGNTFRECERRVAARAALESAIKTLQEKS